MNVKTYYMRFFPYAFLALFLLLVCIDESFAQCPMCKSAAESNLKEGGTHAKGLNAGIIYLFLTPYAIVTTIGVLWWWNNKKAKEAEVDLMVNEMLQETIG
ncbi:MAG: hypothetical protein ACPG5B_10605 [Chitinophagales bacterium]